MFLRWPQHRPHLCRASSTKIGFSHESSEVSSVPPFTLTFPSVSKFEKNDKTWHIVAETEVRGGEKTLKGIKTWMEMCCGLYTKNTNTPPSHSHSPKSNFEAFPACLGMHKKPLFVLPSGKQHLALCCSLYISAISASSSPWHTCFTNHSTTAGAVKHCSRSSGGRAENFEPGLQGLQFIAET